MTQMTENRTLMTAPGDKWDVPLRRILHEQGRKQLWLAGQLGVSHGLVGFWCRGEMEIGPKYVPAIAKLLRVRQKDLRP